MEDSIESAIEKIKQQEIEKETQLKEKRTYEDNLMSLNRGMRDALTQATKLKQDYLEAVARTETLESQLLKEKTRCKALSGLIEDTQKELQILQEKSAQGVTAVWNLRSRLCKSVQDLSDQCDVWALFTKPQSIQLPVTKKAVNDVPDVSVRESNDRLKHAIGRHTKMQVERDHLLREPDTGEEFLR